MPFLLKCRKQIKFSSLSAQFNDKNKIEGKEMDKHVLSLLELLSILYPEILHFAVLEVFQNYKVLKELVPEEIK